MMKKIIVYLLILLITVYPASAGEISLDRWVLNITLHEEGPVDVIIQAEFQNPGPSALDGFSFTVPGNVTIDTDQSTGVTVDDKGEMKFNSPEIQQKTVSSGTDIIINFDKPLESGKKWSGRIGYTSGNIATKDNSGYSLTVPVNAPQVIVAGKNVVTSVPSDSDIRAQVFLPKSYELISVQPDPFRNLFQYGHMVPTWTPEKLHIGDTIRIKASYSDVLAKIVNNDDRSRKLKADIKTAKDAGKNVNDSETHLASANENNEKAFASFGGKDYSVALQYAGFSTDELTKAENSLNSSAAKVTPKATVKTPGFEAFIFGFALLITFMMKRH